MRKKRDVATELSREELLFQRVRTIITTEHITPEMVFSLLLSGHSIWKQGVGIPPMHVMDIVHQAFEGDVYTNRHS